MCASTRRKTQTQQSSLRNPNESAINSPIPRIRGVTTDRNLQPSHSISIDIPSKKTTQPQTKMMLIQQILLALPLLSATGIAGHPTEPPAKDIQGHRHNWNFDLFHDKHCVGTTVSYAGQGSSGCHTNLENGGAEAFINVNVDSKCKVLLFKDKRCSKKAKVEEIKTGAAHKCKAMPRKKAVHSFEVTCW